MNEQENEIDIYDGDATDAEPEFEIPNFNPENQRITTAVCAICKNENPYILEWVAYQKLAGFDEVFIYDNDSDDGTSEALIRLHEAGEITRVYWPRIVDVAPQRSAYADFLQRFSGSFDWVLICDLDEFLTVDNGNVKDFISVATTKYPDVSAVAIPWLVFGASGHEEITDDLVINRFDHCETLCDGAVKPLFRPSKIFNVRTHVVDILSGSYIDNSLRLAEWANIAPTHLSSPSFGYLRIHHYFTKSRKEWERRKSLGRADRSEIQLRNLALFDQYEHLKGRNKQLTKYSNIIKEFVQKNIAKVGVSINPNIVFRNESFVVISLGVNYNANLKVRIVLEDEFEVFKCNIIEFSNGMAGVAIGLTNLKRPLSKLRVSDIESGLFTLINEEEFPTRKGMLKQVLRLMPDAEMIKFNLFRRISNTAVGCEYLKNVNFGSFTKFQEYGDIIDLLKLGGFTAISIDDLHLYLVKHGRMGQAVLDAFNRGGHHVGSLIPDFQRTQYIVY